MSVTYNNIKRYVRECCCKGWKPEIHEKILKDNMKRLQRWKIRGKLITVFKIRQRTKIFRLEEKLERK